MELDSCRMTCKTVLPFHVCVKSFKNENSNLQTLIKLPAAISSAFFRKQLVRSNPGARRSLAPRTKSQLKFRGLSPPDIVPPSPSVFGLSPPDPFGVVG